MFNRQLTQKWGIKDSGPDKFWKGKFLFLLVSNAKQVDHEFEIPRPITDFYNLPSDFPFTVVWHRNYQTTDKKREVRSIKNQISVLIFH